MGTRLTKSTKCSNNFAGLAGLDKGVEPVLSIIVVLEAQWIFWGRAWAKRTIEAESTRV